MADKDCLSEERALERYKSLSEKIRTWLIVYGVSIAAIFVTQATSLSHIARCHKLFVLLPSFFAVMMQLILVITIKYQNLVVYKAYSKDEPLTKQHCSYKVANWWSQSIWIDVIVDILTVICYIVATLVLTFTLTSTPPPTNALEYLAPHSQLGGNDGNQTKEGRQEKEENHKEENHKEENHKEENHKEENRKEENRKEGKGKETMTQGEKRRQAGSVENMLFGRTVDERFTTEPIKHRSRG